LTTKTTLSSNYQEELMTFFDKHLLKQFMTIKPLLHKLFKGIQDKEDEIHTSMSAHEIIKHTRRKDKQMKK
jgi:hypothetical protein